jgi:TonB family protein
MHALAALYLLANTITTQSTYVAPPPGAAAITAPAGIGRPHTCPEEMYPISALQAEAEGRTLLAFKITPQGTVTDVTVDTSSGNADLDAVSVDCAKQWQYRPAMQNGVAVQAPWKAFVAWHINSMLAPPFDRIHVAIAQCANTPRLTKDDFARATLATVMKVRYVRGAVASATVMASSGNPDLDQRLVQCFENLDPDVTADVPDQTMVFPAPWTRYQ